MAANDSRVRIIETDASIVERVPEMELKFEGCCEAEF
jgi:hypothetical protein